MAEHELDKFIKIRGLILAQTKSKKDLSLSMCKK